MKQLTLDQLNVFISTLSQANKDHSEVVKFNHLVKEKTYFEDFIENLKNTVGMENILVPKEENDLFNSFLDSFGFVVANLNDELCYIDDDEKSRTKSAYILSFLVNWFMPRTNPNPPKDTMYAFMNTSFFKHMLDSQFVNLLILMISTKQAHCDNDQFRQLSNVEKIVFLASQSDSLQ